MMTQLRAAALALSLLVVTQSASAQSALTSTVEVERSTPAADGKPPITSYSPSDVVVPGDRLRFSLTFRNDGAEPATGVAIKNPIQDGLIFDGTPDLAGFDVSTDQGASFAPLATLTVPVEGADRRAATNADVTNVRWVWSDAIAPGQTRTVTFFAKVK